MPTSLPYRLGVGIVLINAKGQVFVAQRRDMQSPAWQMPQGGVDEGETPLQAAIRELEEETSITSAQCHLIAESAEWFCYDLPADLAGKLWGGKYCGQKQKWFAMRFTGTDADINLETEHPEFTRWEWVDAAQVPARIVPFKRELYQQIIKEFSPLLAHR